MVVSAGPMHAAALFAALTVTSPEGVGCPEQSVVMQRLRDAGIELLPEEDIRVRFSAAGRTRIAEIEMPGATPRRIENDNEDCASLGEATIALLTVLLDERAARARTEAKPAPAPASVTDEPKRPLRIEAGLVASNGIVAPLAAGIAIGAAWRVSRWGSIGLVAEGHPPRDHAVDAGVVRVAAANGALVGCGGLVSLAYSLEGCLLAHVGIHVLSGEGFPVVDTTERLLGAGEAAVRFAYSIVPAVGIFMRAGAWLPLTRLDVAVRGAEPGFSTTSIGPKAVIGMELRL